MLATAIEPLETKVNQSSIRLERGDLTAMAVDAIVFYAKETLELGSGFGTGIQSRGGPSIKAELDKIGRIEMGQAVLTTGGRLNARHVIHACGPKFMEADTERKLRQTMRSALAVAAQHKLKTVAFPPMGAGFYGVPLDLCAQVMLEEVTTFLQNDSTLETVIICVIDKREFNAFEKVLKKGA